MHPVVLNYFRRLRKRQVVRPWALATPILVLLVTLPLLRPLRSPEPMSISTNEASRLAAVQALAEQHTQEIDQTAFFGLLRAHDFRKPPDTVEADGRYYSDKAPVLSAILAGAYSVMLWFGLSMQTNQAMVVYLLTILCSVVPVAAVAGMVYRMGRLFELRRPWRTLLAAVVTFGSGLVSYAVVINAHAPAAALVLGACACLVHITVAREPTRTGAWLMISGLCASLAAAIDPSALVFAVGLIFVIVALRWRKRLRFGGAMLYLIGAVPPIALHAVMTVPITGDLLPPALHPEFQRRDLRFAMAAEPSPVDANDDDDAPVQVGWFRSTVRSTVRGSLRVLGALVGNRGILSHFPVLIFGLLGIGAVLRRHWPIATKAMAGVTLVGGAIVIVGQPWFQADSVSGVAGGAFGPRWFVLFLPLTLFWAGAWLRKSHHPLTWVAAAVSLVFSAGVSLLGTTAPFLVAPGRYTANVALQSLIHPPPAPAIERAAVASN